MPESSTYTTDLYVPGATVKNRNHLWRVGGRKDDVLIASSIDAGLIVTELMGCGLANRTLMAVSASLREQWLEAMDYFFDIGACTISTHHRRAWIP